jgi:hypothetical protein
VATKALESGGTAVRRPQHTVRSLGQLYEPASSKGYSFEVLAILGAPFSRRSRARGGRERVGGNSFSGC